MPMSYNKVFAINVIVFVGIFLTLEVLARLVFPEFKNHIHNIVTNNDITTSNKTMNINFYSGKFFPDNHFFHLRKPNAESYKPNNKEKVIVIGDSISKGYGTAYEDIWWQKLERLLSVKGENTRQFIAYGYSGNSMVNALDTLKEISRLEGKKVSHILYQFNFNDITPFKKQDLKTVNDGRWISNNVVKKVAMWRMEYGNHSVFLRTAQHYLGKYIRKTSGSCEERGIGALGPYTWSYGSKAYRDEATFYWDSFEENLVQMSNISKSLGAEFQIVISPILYDIDKKGIHPHFNYLDFDFSCATINPRENIVALGERYKIKIYDPAFEIRRSFEARLEEGNFTPYFFAGDDNHFNSTAATYFAEVIAKDWH